MTVVPSSDFSEVISKVLSSLIPPRAYQYLFACIPGLFFETSILLANPAFFHGLFANSAITLGHSLKLSIALFLAFVIGSGFMLFVTLIERFLSLCYKLRAAIWRQLCAWPLLPLLTRMIQSARWNKRRWVRNFFQHVQTKHDRMPDNFLEPERCWARIAGALLQKRYGVNSKDLSQGEWNALYWALAPLTPEDQRGSPFMIASEAIGWCGLAATRFAPALKNNYYLAFSGLMIIMGLFYDWYFVSGKNDPRFLGIMKVRSLLRHFDTSPAERKANTGGASQIEQNGEQEV